MRVAVIGLGSIGTRHVKNIIALGHDVTGLDTRKQALWLEDECGWARTWDDLINSLPEAVLICTPAATHAEVARRLAGSSYSGPLFVEKPLTTSLKDAEIFRTWPHPTTMVGYNLRFHPQVAAMRAFVQAPTSGQFFLDCDSRQWPGQSQSSMLLECSHEIDLALSFGASPLVNEASGDGHEMAISLGKDRDTNWRVVISDRSPNYRRQWSLMSWEPTRRGSEASAFFYGPQELGDQMYRDEMAHFIDCAERFIPTTIPFDDGLRVLDVCEQAERMACVR